MCPHKSTNTKEGGGPDSERWGYSQRKREILCVCFFRSFSCIPSFVERGCWQHHHHYSLKCLLHSLSFIKSSSKNNTKRYVRCYCARSIDRSIFRDVVVYVVVYVVVGFRFHRVGKERRLFGLERLVYISSRVRHHR